MREKRALEALNEEQDLLYNVAWAEAALENAKKRLDSYQKWLEKQKHQAAIRANPKPEFTHTMSVWSPLLKKSVRLASSKEEIEYWLTLQRMECLDFDPCIWVKNKTSTGFARLDQTARNLKHNPGYVFVYGTLLSTEGNHGLFNVGNYAIRSIVPAYTQGILWSLGGCPGMTKVPEGTKFTRNCCVLGELIQVNNIEATLELLDRLEGHREGEPGRSAYYRYETPVYTAAGTVTAWAYWWQGDPIKGRLDLIESGSWKAHTGKQELFTCG